MKVSEIFGGNKSGKACQFMKCFKECWDNEYPPKRAEIDGHSRDNTTWTKSMLGKKEANGVYGDTFLKRVCEKFIQHLNYKHDLAWHLDGWYTVDACVVEKDKTRNWYLASHWHLILEHENGPNIEEEMWKLLHFKAPLKVLIGYDYYDDQKESSEAQKAWLEGKIKRLDYMNRGAFAVHPESKDTEYLLIIGSRRKQMPDGDLHGELQWRFWRATPNAEFKQINPE